MSLEKLAAFYAEAGFTFELADGDLIVEIEGHKFKGTYEEDWRKAIDAYFKAKQYAFDEKRHLLTAYKSIEIQLVRLSPVFPPGQEHSFTDGKGSTVEISLASKEFTLAFNTSKSHLKPIEVVKRRLLRRASNIQPRRNGYYPLYKTADLFVAPYTGKYSVQRKVDGAMLTERGIKSIKSSLFKLAYNSGESWELREALPPGTAPLIKPEEADGSIPKAIYNDDLLKYYKVARSSIFPNQQFLSYYHVLEYFFLRVSDEILHTSVKGVINSPSFNSSYQCVNRLLATLKKHDNSSDETEMLKSVLSKYIDEDELIAHISAIEKEASDKIYTDSKKRVFGEAASIRLEKGHALNNAARVVKQIRNALVHSSDRYNREDCFLPLSESESVVIQYVPLVKFLAERVIFSTADGA